MSSNLLRNADVTDDEEDDDEMFSNRGPRGAGLGSLFVSAAVASSSKLQYQPPKAPAPSRSRDNKNSRTHPAPAAAVVDAFRFDKSSGSYTAEGKVGCALVTSGKGRASEEQAQTHLVLYRGNRQKLALTVVDTAFRLDVLDDLYACFNDARSGETWSVRFTCEADLTAIAKGVAISKVPRLLKKCAVIAQDIKPGKKDSLAVGDRCLVDFTYSGWSLDPENRCIGIKLDEGEKGGVKIGDVGDICRGWTIGMQGMKESGERFVIVPPDFGYSEKGLSSKVPEGSILAFLIRLDCVRPEVDHMEESEAGLNSGRVLVDKSVSKMGQLVLPFPRVPLSAKTSESETSSTHTEASIASAISFEQAASGASINNLMLAESRLQNTELRMTLTRLDDKLERLTSLVAASPSSMALAEPNKKAAALTKENERLRADNRSLAEENAALGDSNQILTRENEDLRRKFHDMEEALNAANPELETTEKARGCGRGNGHGRGEPKETVTAEMDNALFDAEVRKRVKRVLGKVYKRLQSEFAGDQMMHSGEDVKERLANSIRLTVSLLEESDGRNKGSQGGVHVTTPVAFVNPISNDAIQ